MNPSFPKHDLTHFLSRTLPSPSPPAPSPRLWALCAVPTGLRLFSAPAPVQETLTREFSNNMAWRKTDAIWQRRHHAGKRLVMFMAG